MLKNWNTSFIYFLLIIFIFFGCSASTKNINNQNQKNNKEALPPRVELTNNTPQTTSTDTQNMANQQLSYQIKKLNAEINYLKEQVQTLDIKSSLYADPFDIYNKEIILNNGSSIFCKILSQDDQNILVETLIGNLTINRSTVVRIVENITVLEEGEKSEAIIEISTGEEEKIISEAELIDKRKAQSSASIIVLGDIKESRDKSGNTIFEGELKNIGTERADLVRIDFILRKTFQGDIETFTAYALGSSHVFKDTGIMSNSSIKPGALGTFKLIIPNSLGNFIGYSYQVDWSYYE